MANTKTSRTRVGGKSGYHHGDLRQQLVSAARQLVAKNGTEYFKLATACRLAGVSTAAPYRHFADKQALLDAVAIDGFQELSRQIEKNAAGFEAGSPEAIAAIGEGYVAFASAQPTLFRLMFGSSHNIVKNDKDDPESAGSECYNILLRHVSVFLGLEHIDEHVIRTAFPLWTFVHGLSFLIIDDKLEVSQMSIDIEDVIATATRQLLSGKGR